jgi:predicted ester cyclase
VGGPSNNEMKQTKPAMARIARSSLLILVLRGPT